MATQNASNWTLSQLVTAAEKFTFADGRADIDETRALIGLIRPFAATDPDLAAFQKLLIDIEEDGVVTPEESAALAKAIAALRAKYQASDGVYDARTLGLPKMGVLGVQHMFAMFGATILVPILTGLSPSATLLWAGLGTLLFHLVTKRMVPAFLGSSFAYLAGYFALAGMAGTVGYETVSKSTMLQYACLGVASSSLVYFIVAGFVKACGVKTVMKFFPPVVTGPIIIGIGLVLAPVAINSCTSSWPVAVIAIVTVIAFSIFGKGMFRIIPILMGVIVSYLAAVVFGKFGWCDAIDYTNVANAAWIGLPVKWENTVFPLLSSPDWGRIVSAVAIVFPLAFATIMEHVGDVSAISSTVKRNFFENPGLHRTMLGDGLATCLASLFGAPANTTYGENTGVLSLSKVYMISAVGVRNLVESQVDLGKSRNMLIAALILVLTLGISFSKAGAIAFTVGSLKISLSGLAVGALLGIVLNAILPGKDFAFSETAPSIKDAERFGGPKPKKD